MSGEKRRRSTPSAYKPPAAEGVRSHSGWSRSALPTALVVLVGAIAWVAAGQVARRASGATVLLPAAVADLPSAARDRVTATATLARSRPDSADAIGELGRALHAAALSDEALVVYEQAEHLNPPAFRWPYLRAVLLEERGRIDEARQALTEATRRDGGSGLAWFHLAEIAFKQGRLDDAESAYTRAVAALPATPFLPDGVTTRRAAPLSAYAQLGLARIAIERQQPAQAMTIVDTIVASEPSFGPAYALRSSLDSRPDAAIPPAARAYVPPNDPEVDMVIAMSAMRDLLLKHAAVAARGGDREWREFLVRRAAQFNPRDPNVLMELAAMLQATNRATEALDVLRQHEQLVPGDHHTLVEQGRCLADLGRLEEAEAVLRRAAHVRDAAAEYNLGTVVDRLGRTEEARGHYEKALAIDPFHARALNNLGVLLDRGGESAKAIATLERAAQADPGNADAYTNLGSALINARRLSDALRALDLAVALDPEAANAHNNRGIALAQSGRLQEAVAEWNTTLRLDPAHLNARRNVEQVQRLPR